jgi:hypothetical protein
MIRKNGTSKVYRIVVRSELSDRYAVAFEGMQMARLIHRSAWNRILRSSQPLATL